MSDGDAIDAIPLPRLCLCSGEVGERGGKERRGEEGRERGEREVAL